MSKHPSEMTDAEFAAALHRRAWRAASVKVVEPDLKPAAALTDAEFDKAVRNRAWRTLKALA